MSETQKPQIKEETKVMVVSIVMAPLKLWLMKKRTRRDYARCRKGSRIFKTKETSIKRVTIISDYLWHRSNKWITYSKSTC